MIKVKVEEKNNLINYICIKGHANYAENGKDIVCASVSSIVITTINSIVRIDSSCIDYHENDGLIEIKILKHTDIIDHLIENMLDLLNELAKNYSKYIKIN